MTLIKDLGVIQVTEKTKRRRGIYECPDCLKHFETTTADVKAGKSTRCKSCGTIKTKTTHGMNRTPLHKTWTSMKTKCYAPNTPAYKYYGAKGVTVCDEWKNDFMAFYTWCMDNGYEQGLHLDKDILCDEQKIYPKVYSPTTCKFITGAENVGYTNKARHETNHLRCV